MRMHQSAWVRTGRVCMRAWGRRGGRENAMFVQRSSKLEARVPLLNTSHTQAFVAT